MVKNYLVNNGIDKLDNNAEKTIVTVDFNFNS